MKTTITGKNMVVSPGVSERVLKKTSKMERYLNPNTEIFVRLTREKNNRRTCEITVPFEGVVLRAEASNDDNLYVSIDQALAKLERQIGVRLFERSTAKVALTDAGKLLQGEWSAMLERCDQAVVRARAVQDAGRPSIRIGLLELCGVVDFVLPRLSAYNEAHPGGELEYEIGGFLQVQEWLFMGQVDAIVTFNYEVARLPDRYQFRNLRDMDVFIILSRRHPLARREQVTLSDLKGQVIYAFAPNYSTYASDTVLTHCRKLGFEPEFK